MKQYKFLLLALSLLAACNTVTEKKTGTEDMVHYRNLILSIIINQSLGMHQFDPGMPYYSMIDDTADAMLIRKEACDTYLGIKMRKHAWQSGYITNFVFYIANNTGFEYAFPFYAQATYYNYLGEDVKAENGEFSTKSNYYKEVKSEQQANSRRFFSDCMSYVSRKIALKGKDSAERFMHLFADSIMGLKELTVKDTSFIKQTIARQLEQDSVHNRLNNDIYTVKLKEHISEIISDLQQKEHWTHYYYSPQLGTLLFWKFIIQKDNLDYYTHKKIATFYYLSVEFINGEFHVPVYF